MKILPDYEHMEYRDVYTCRTYLTPHAVAAAAAAAAAWAIAGGWVGGRVGGLTCFPPWEMLFPGFSSFPLLQLCWVALSGSLGSLCMDWVSTVASRVLGSPACRSEVWFCLPAPCSQK